MLDRLFAWLGVDRRQWWALTRSSIKQDVFAATLGGPGGQRRNKRGHPLIGPTFYYLFMGLIFMPLVFLSPSLTLVAVLGYSVLMMFTVSMVLVEFHSVILAPQDYEILSYQPVDSRTFFFSRLANAIYYTLWMTLPFSVFPTVASWILAGFFAGLAYVGGAVLAAVSTTLACILFYAALIRLVNPKRLKRLIAYLQMIFTALFIGLYLLIPRLHDESILQQAESQLSAGMLFLPPLWFAGFAGWAGGQHSWLMGVCMVLAVAIPIALLAFAARYLSLDYAQRLATFGQARSGQPAAATKPWKRGRLFGWGERKAVAMLIQNHFKHDLRFQMGVLGVLPLTLMYFFLALMQGNIEDPFAQTRAVVQEAGGNATEVGINMGDLLVLAVMLFPLMLKNILVNSESYQASWIYFATPSDRARLVMATKDCIVAFFIVPYLLVMLGIYAWAYGHVGHALLHVALLAVLVHLLLQLVFLISSDLPFSQPARKGERSSKLFMLVMVIPMLFVFMVMPLLYWLVYVSMLRFALLLGGGILLSLLLERLLRFRINFASRGLQYLG